VKVVTDSDRAKYTEFLITHQNCHFMQSLSWADFKKTQKSYALMSLDDYGNVRGVMLMFEQKVRRTNKMHLYCPRGPVCDRNDTITLSELLVEAEKLAKEIDAYKLTLDPDITEKDAVWLSFFKNLGARIGDNARDNAILQPFAVYRINVGKTDDELMASYHSKARYSVRASIKSDATCRIGTREDIPVFRALLAETAKRDSFTARNDEYFYDMYDALGDDAVKLFMIECAGEPIAASVLIRCGAKTWHMYAGSSENHKETLPNFLMQWEMMRWSRDNNAPLYDMRGIAGEGDKLLPIEGLVRFKKRFGGELVTFVGRIDIVYDRKTDMCVNILKSTAALIRRLMGRK
ncbi:MAG: peptidoglycan bridge formation glycyltransferase FemA/FemB family protein, partial [Oscillospiraceae bacterium]|nr:peptidoglycan bridge formation glycyltransferase FemA/FemB family protein [Oscillospiraceae bacterium]